MTGMKARYGPEVLDHIAAKRSSFDAAEGATWTQIKRSSPLPLLRDLERFRFSLNRMRFPNQFCSDSLMLAGWRPALDDRTDIE